MKLKLHFLLTFVMALVLANTSNATTYTAVASGLWNAPATWDANGVPDNLGTADVVIPNADTVTINTNFTINNLTIGGGTSGGLQFTKSDSNLVATVNGNILVQTGAVFKALTNTTGGKGVAHFLVLKGNLTHNGSVLDFRNGTAGSTLSVVNLTLSGSTDQTLTVNGSYSSTNGDFNSVTINKPAGKVILGSNIAMAGGSSTGNPACNTIMTFISGIIETGAYTWICQTSTAANVVGYSSASYIVGAMGRGMSNSLGSSKDFPVGDANGYELFTLRSTTSGLATGHYAVVRCVSGNANTGSSSFTNGIDKVSQVRYYQVSYGQLLGSGAASMGFDRFWASYNYDDGVAQGNTNLRVAYSTDNRSTWNGLNQLSLPHTTKHSLTPPTQIKPDSLPSSPVDKTVTLTAGGSSMYLALARNTGTSENTLQTSVVLHPTVLFEAMYNVSGDTATAKPVVTIELHDASTYALVESQTNTLSSAGVGYFTFSTAVNNTPYYIVVKTWNTLETWSMNTQSFISSLLSYNFTTAQTQAYSDNLTLLGTKWCIYSGDVNQDGYINLGDYNLVNNDSYNQVTGVVVTDVTGDQYTNLADYNIVNNNSYNQVKAHTPLLNPSAGRIKPIIKINK